MRFVQECEAVQVLDECQSALGWLEEKKTLQDSMRKTDDPVLVTADIKKKEETLARVADPILNKPPPKKVWLGLTYCSALSDSNLNPLPVLCLITTSYSSSLFCWCMAPGAQCLKPSQI